TPRPQGGCPPTSGTTAPRGRSCPPEKPPRRSAKRRPRPRAEPPASRMPEPNLPRSPLQPRPTAISAACTTRLPLPPASSHPPQTTAPSAPATAKHRHGTDEKPALRPMAVRVLLRQDVPSDLPTC